LQQQSSLEFPFINPLPYSLSLSLHSFSPIISSLLLSPSASNK
jgi:hypothetical protein